MIYRSICAFPLLLFVFKSQRHSARANKRRGRGKKLNRLKLKFEKAVGEFLSLVLLRTLTKKKKRKKGGGETEAELDMLIQEAAIICN